jgi:hypothetical protein
MKNGIFIAGLDSQLQELLINSSRLLLEDSNIVTVADREIMDAVIVRLLDSELGNNGIRQQPINIFRNTVFDYYLCHLVIDCSNFHTLREGYRNRGVFLEFCGAGTLHGCQESLSIIPRSHLVENDLRSKVVSLLGMSRYVQTGNHLVDSRYEIESSDDLFASKILTNELLALLSKSKSITISIKNYAIYCSTGSPKPHDIIVLKEILEHILKAGRS